MYWSRETVSHPHNHIHADCISHSVHPESPRESADRRKLRNILSASSSAIACFVGSEPNKPMWESHFVRHSGLLYNVALHCIHRSSRSIDKTSCEVRTIHIYPCPLMCLKGKSDSWDSGILPSGIIYQRLRHGKRRSTTPSRMQISAHNSLCKRPETTTYERVMRAAVIHTCPRHLSVLEIPLAKSKTRLCNFPPSPLPRERSNPF